MEHARYQPDIFYVYAIDGFLTQVNASLFITYPVSNFTFDGIYDSILEGVDSTSGIELPIPFDKFGWFYPVSIHATKKSVLSKCIRCFGLRIPKNLNI